AIWSDTMWLSGIVPNFEGSSTMGLVQGIGVVVGARTGVFIILALASVFLIPLLSIVESNRIFLIVPIMVIFPFFHIAMYFSESLTPFYFLAGGLTLLLIYSFITQKTSKPILKKAAAAMVFIVLISSLAFSTYTVDYRVSYEDTPETDINMIKDHEYDTALYLREYRDDVDILGGGRMMAFYGDDPRINASGVEVVRRSTPELFDFFGWYNFLKQPFGAVVSRVPYENYYTYRYTDLYYKNANLAGNGTTATAIGPIGATDRGEVTIRYVATGSPSSVSLYYSIDGGRMWIFIGNDQTADGEFSWTLPEPGTYHWYAATGTMANPLPVGRAPPQTEACVYYTGLGYNIYDNGKMRIWYRN
ncbi:MAG: hypothetical protein QCI38_00915, partial [Candidatus Thermoplasmatota archaeon]|nr:hypothetical protein [Candidatus Thermoplasmatota archaeon]